jgi:uncharacterized protein YpmS
MSTWQKSMIIILAIVVLPITLFSIIIYLLSPKSDSEDLKNDKWYHTQQKKQVEKTKIEMEKAKKKTENILIERSYELEKIGKQNEEAADIITDIRRASSPNELDELRKRIDALGK